MSLQDDISDAGALSGPVQSMADPRSRTLREFLAIERLSKATYSELRKRGHAPDELRVPNSKIVRITFEAHVAWREFMAELAKNRSRHLGGGSAASPSRRSRQGCSRLAIRRAAMLILQLEFMETRWAAGNGEAGVHLYSRVTGKLAKLLATLGLKQRNTKTLSLSDLIIEDEQRGAALVVREREETV